jgi:hypothetical protein
MVKLVLGEFGSVILKGQRVIPRRLLDAGFVFRYRGIDKASASIVRPGGEKSSQKAIDDFSACSICKTVEIERACSRSFTPRIIYLIIQGLA